jgi:hypothetical protein
MEAEHRNIETVVKALGDLAVTIEKGRRVEGALLEAAVEFFVPAPAGRGRRLSGKVGAAPSGGSRDHTSHD